MRLSCRINDTVPVSVPVLGLVRFLLRCCVREKIAGVEEVVSPGIGLLNPGSAVASLSLSHLVR